MVRTVTACPKALRFTLWPVTKNQTVTRITVEEEQALSRVAIVTDSNSGITQETACEMGIRVLPMPFTIDGKEYFEGISLTQKEFYERLAQDADIATSQPSPESVMDLWKELLMEYDEVVHIPMSSGLSGSCQTAIALADDFDGKVQVVNNQRISITQRQTVADADRLAESEAGIQHLYYGGNAEIPEKGRTPYACSGSYRNLAAHQAGSADPGRTAGYIFQGTNHAAGKENHARCHPQ